ncbi:MAG: hypothetical protein AAF138_04775 [Planctomycetota bacterium]
MDWTAWTEVIARTASLIGVSACLVWLFRRIRVPGGRPAAAVAGGLVAGVLLGPGVLGPLSPPLYERVVIGAHAEREAVGALMDRQAEARAALARSGVSDIAVDELENRHAEAIALAEGTLADAEQMRARAAAALSLGGFAFAVLGAGLLGRRPLPGGRDEDDPGAIVGLVGGVMGGLVAGLATAAIAHRLLGMDLQPAIGLGGAIGTGGLLAPIATRWIPRCGRSRLAAGLTLGMVVVGFAGVGWGAGLDGWGWWAPIGLAWFAGLLIPAALGAGGAPRSAVRAVRGWSLWIAAPWVIAEVAVRVEPTMIFHTGWVFLVLLIPLVGCGDGHGAGMWLAMKTHGRGLAQAEPALTSFEALMRSGPVSSVAMLLALMGAGVIDTSTGPGAAAAVLVLINAASLELQLDWARVFARRLDGTMRGSET